MGSQFISWDVYIGHGKTVYVSNDISSGTAHRNIIYFLKSFKGCCSFVESGTENVFLGSYRSRLTDSDGMARKKAPGLNGSRMENEANSQGAAQSLH